MEANLGRLVRFHLKKVKKLGLYLRVIRALAWSSSDPSPAVSKSVSQADKQAGHTGHILYQSNRIYCDIENAFLSDIWNEYIFLNNVSKFFK